MVSKVKLRRSKRRREAKLSPQKREEGGIGVFGTDTQNQFYPGLVRSLIIHLQTHFPHFREIILQPYWIKESVASSYTVL